MAAGLEEAKPEEVGLSSETLAGIDRWLEQLIAEGELPGAVTLVARRGRVVHRSVQGLKDIARGEPLAFDSLFRIFSMTKPVTAVAMMILHDRGLWSPDDPIARHLPEFGQVRGPDGAAPAHAPTMAELMTHTAGFGYAIAPPPHDATDAAYVAAGVWKADGLAEFSRRVAGVALAYQPGTSWRYSLSMDLQGAIIERLTGRSLPDFMAQEIFAPLGMIDTGFHVPAEKLSRLGALYHKYGMPELTVLEHPGFVRDPLVAPAIPSGGGGLYSTVADYARFAQMLLNRGELGGVRIVSPGAVAMMTTNHLSDALLEQGFVAGVHHLRPGYGYGFNGAVFIDPAKLGSPVGAGTYQWDGAAGGWFWVDPENELIYVGLIHRMLQEGMPRLQEGTQERVMAAFL